MENIRDKTAIVGVGYTPQGKIPGRSPISFYVEAASNAIADAGLKIEDIDGLLVQPVWLTRPCCLVAQQLGIRTRFLADEDAGGATAGFMAQHAAWAVIHGLANYVVCVYGDSSMSSEANMFHGSLGADAEFGMFGAAAHYALGAQRAMHEFGTGPETWSQIAVAQRRWANLNPRAQMYQKPMSLEDYYNSKLIAEPFRQFDCCLVSDGGRAFIVTTAERAKACRRRPVYIMGMGQDHPATYTAQAPFLAGSTGAKISGEQAFKMAGVTKDDIDACEIYDCFTYTVEITLMDYGFFGPGESQDFLKVERLEPGGDFPLNTSGGLLSEAYFMGFTPLTEAVVQLQGEAGKRQLGSLTKTKEPEIILVSGNGMVLQMHSTLILRR